MKPTVGPLLNERGEQLHGMDNTCEELNHYFASVFTKDDTSALSVSYLQEDSIPQLFQINITYENVQEYLTKLRSDKAAGTDDLSPRLLKEIAENIVEPLTIIFRKSLQEATVSEDWKTANIMPIFKKGQRQKAANYRPISLTSVLCKIMEAVISDAIVNHLETNKLITDTQHDF